MVDPRQAFEPDVADTWMEIGFGAGEHLVAQARAHPDIGFIGCEPYLNGIAALLPAIAEAGLDNVRIFADDARELVTALAPASLGRLFILFPDPWPKTRHHARRLINAETIRAFARVLRPGAELRLASDHEGYVRWMLEHLTRDRSFLWLARRPCDWRGHAGTGRPTRYEQKALACGRPCTSLRFTRVGSE